MNKSSTTINTRDVPEKMPERYVFLRVCFIEFLIASWQVLLGARIISIKWNARERIRVARRNDRERSSPFRQQDDRTFKVEARRYWGTTWRACMKHRDLCRVTIYAWHHALTSKNHPYIFTERAALFIQGERNFLLQSTLLCQASIKRSGIMRHMSASISSSSCNCPDVK